MITEAQFDERAKDLYKWMQGRLREKKWKSGRRAGTIRVHKQELPFTYPQFQVWLWREIGIHAKACPWCGTPIDVFSMEIDHKTPLNLGGELGFENLQCICGDCNRLKGELMPSEYRELRNWLFYGTTVSEHLRADILSRLRSAAMGKRLRYFPAKKKGDKPASKPPKQLSLKEPF
jgi:5-methylcytosine-specific restriction endonuclease McrA